MNDHPIRPEDRPELRAVIEPWRLQVAEDNGLTQNEVLVTFAPSNKGDTFEVRLFNHNTNQELAKKNYYIDLNGFHEMDERKK